LKFGDGRSWKLIEKLAADIAEMILSDFQPKKVTVEIKSFRFRSAIRFRHFEKETELNFCPSIVSNWQPFLSARMVTAPELRV